MASNIHSSFVNKNEAEALKEMIFNRVRERAEALNSNIEASYTSDIKFDVMDAARKSFVSDQNPFSEINKSQDISNNTVTNTKITEENLEKMPVIQEEQKTASVANDFAKRLIVENMNQARNELTNKKGFMGALNFLNSQAAGSLFRNKDDSFNTLA